MSDRAIESRQLRDALGLFATGVCLVATHDSGGEPCAVTVNSFSSVSLEPPLVLWSVQKDSDLYSVYRNASRYSIAVLNDQQQEHSIRYSQKGSHKLLPEHFSVGESGAPVIPDALVNFECSLMEAIDGGDHTILVGKVINLLNGPVGKPLLYFGGNYRALP
ncbi:MAG: flavin reductase family protein [Pseudomonadota bacterium]